MFSDDLSSKLYPTLSLTAPSKSISCVFDIEMLLVKMITHEMAFILTVTASLYKMLPVDEVFCPE